MDSTKYQAKIAFHKSCNQDCVTSGVQRFYNKFPYPGYPFLARPKTINQFFCTAEFAQNVLKYRYQNEIKKYTKVFSPKILIAGCGDSQPLLMKLSETSSTEFVFCDLSQKSLDRARLRNLIHFPFKKSNDSYQCADISIHQFSTLFHHIDATGVIHHCENPIQAIQNLSNHLIEGGTMRIMVYNPYSRDFIEKISAYFRELKLTTRDQQELRKHFQDFRGKSPSLGQKLKSLEPILKNPSRLADTFFHPHNVLATYADWSHWFKQCGLSILGIFDRYGELDDLLSPLHHPPKEQAIEERCRDKRFENNFEFFLCKFSENALQLPKNLTLQKIHSRNFPKVFTQFNELKEIAPQKIARALNYYINTNEDSNGKARSLSSLPERAKMRLFRLGLIYPREDQDFEIYASPLQEQMEAPPQILYPNTLESV